MPLRDKQKLKEYQAKYIKQHYLDNKQYYKDKNKKRMSSLSWEQRLFETVRSRARRVGLEFNLELSDIKIPEVCPVLGKKFVFFDKYWSASIDRIDNDKGYIKGNIAIISKRANWLKSNATLEEIEQLYNWYKITLNP